MCGRGDVCPGRVAFLRGDPLLDERAELGELVVVQRFGARELPDAHEVAVFAGVVEHGDLGPRSQSHTVVDAFVGLLAEDLLPGGLSFFSADLDDDDLDVAAGEDRFHALAVVVERVRGLAQHAD